MLRYLLLVCAAMMFGCEDDYEHPLPAPCVVAYDCVNNDPCTVPQCQDNVCLYANELDGSLCDTVDGYHGVCDSGLCIGISDAPLLNVPPSKCVEHSDCFIQQCTNSICNYGYCGHVAYENNVTCFGTSDGEIYVGVCVDGTCK